MISSSERVQARVARLQPVVHWAVEVDTQVKACSEAGARERCAVQGAGVVRLQQVEDGVPVRGVSTSGEQYGARCGFTLAYY